MAWSLPQVPVTGWVSAELLPFFCGSPTCINYYFSPAWRSPRDVISPRSWQSLVVLGWMGGHLAGSANMPIVRS